MVEMSMTTIWWNINSTLKKIIMVKSVKQMSRKDDPWMDKNARVITTSITIQQSQMYSSFPSLINNSSLLEFQEPYVPSNVYWLHYYYPIFVPHIQLLIYFNRMFVHNTNFDSLSFYIHKSNKLYWLLTLPIHAPKSECYVVCEAVILCVGCWLRHL